MGKKLYVGNLGYGIGERELEDLFRPFGTVESAKVITDRDTGQSKGFGFVEMASDSEAQAAIDALNGKEVEGRQLTVNEARPQENRGGGGSRSGGYHGGGGFGGGHSGHGGSGGRGGFGGGRSGGGRGGFGGGGRRGGDR